MWTQEEISGHPSRRTTATRARAQQGAGRPRHRKARPADAALLDLRSLIASAVSSLQASARRRLVEARHHLLRAHGAAIIDDPDSLQFAHRRKGGDDSVEVVARKPPSTPTFTSQQVPRHMSQGSPSSRDSPRERPPRVRPALALSHGLNVPPRRAPFASARAGDLPLSAPAAASTVSRIWPVRGSQGPAAWPILSDHARGPALDDPPDPEGARGIALPRRGRARCGRETAFRPHAHGVRPVVPSRPRDRGAGEFPG